MPVLPEGLSWCEFCGKVRGTTPDGSVSSCLCDGIVCRYCGAGRIDRPISDVYVPDRDGSGGRWMHMAYFGNQAPCGPCERLAYPDPSAQGAYGFPGPLREDPSIAALPNLHREAAAALAVTREKRPPDHDRQRREGRTSDPPAWVTVRQAVALRDRPPGGLELGLYALHAEADAWAQLGLPHPPDGRPLALGRAGADPDPLDPGAGSALRRDLAALLHLRPAAPDEGRLTAWILDRLKITVWAPRAQTDAGRIAAMLIERWRPPFPANAGPTPWSAAIAAAREQASS